LERLSERCVSVRRHVEQAVQAEMHTLRTQLYSLRSSVHTELQHVLDGVTQQTTAAIDEVRRSATHAAAEGAAQVGSTLRASGLVRHQLYDESRTLLGRVWTFLTQPVLVPRSRGEARVQRRGLLFLQDTLRFGGTFAGIFAALFLTLNAQSFWQIALANLDPLAGHDTGQEIAEHLIAQAQPNPLNEDQAIAVVPTVGPPEDRLVIPRLGLNVPIVTPRLDALLAQDWTILEQDIQTALEDGVVHYPGTAEPGQAGNFFVTGHSSYYAWAEGDYKSVFARLSELQPGDEYWVYYGGDEHRYRVVESLEVKPTEVHVLDQPTDQRQSTLMTCSPVGTTLRRRIVRALEVDVASGQLLAVGEHGTQPNLPKVQLNALPI
jgi:LPXTG-site transpeptidase (sortase) family protein